MANPQTLQTAMSTAGYAYAGAMNAHIGLHQTMHELRHGSLLANSGMGRERACK